MKYNRIVKYLSTLVLFMLVFCVQAQSWQQHFDEGKRLYNAKDYEGAFKAFQDAHAAAPNPAQIDPFLAQSAYRAGMFKEAADAYNRSIVNNSDTWSHYNEGNAHFKNSDFEKAIESYKQALRKDPTNDVARYNLTQAMKKMKEQQEQQNQNNNQNQNSQNSNQNNNPSDPNQQKPEKNQDNPDNQNQESQGQNQPKLGREQTDQLLESMNQADKKAKDKLKEKEKVEGQGKREKDW